MKGKKLPVVWVELDEESDGCLVPYAVRPYASVGAVRYTPAKPVKVCRWTDDDEFWIVGCKQFSIQGDAQTYCPYCGGKIKVKR